MENKKTFSGVLARVRKEQGFSSAHKFFKSTGGSKTLGLSFMSYWDMERGRKLPKSWRLLTIIKVLGLPLNSRAARELLRAYFIDLSGSEELLRILELPLAAAAAAGGPADQSLAEAATRQALSHRAANLTLEQWRLRAGNLAVNFCGNYLANTEGWSSIREVAAATGFTAAAVKNAFKALAAGGLAEFSGERARSQLTGKIEKYPPATPETAPVKKALLAQWESWLKNSPIVERKRMTVRMTRADMDAYRSHLQQAVGLANIYENPGEDRDNSAVYLVDGTIYKIFPRK